LRPDYADGLSNRGTVLYALKRFDEALASFDAALALRPDYAEALSNRGAILQELGRFDDALASYDRALALTPNYVEALSNRSNTLRALNRFEEALASCDRALALRPDYAEGLSNRGNALRGLNRFEEALASYDRALAVRPDYAEALSNRGTTLQDLRRFDAALMDFAAAVRLRPDYAGAHVNEALCRLLTGDFARGWDGYEWRWELDYTAADRRNFTQPMWVGGDEIAGKTILLHAEQGLGDTIQFCRYVPMVAERAGRVILEAQKQLCDLMGSLPAAVQIMPRNDPLPRFDLHCPLLSLPRAFRTRLETIPAATPYLRASSQAVMAWKERLVSTRRPKIGLAWSGNPANKNDHNRSITLNSLLPMLDCDATFVSLQWAVRGADIDALKERTDLLHFGDELKDLSETAALISNLDLVISVDTVFAHLAGALAVPVWILLPYAPDWRWLVDRDDSPWYPTARLFRQDDTCTWGNVVKRIQAALRAL